MLTIPFSKFNALCSFHFWSFSPFHVLSPLGVPTPTNTLTFPYGSSSLYTYTIQCGPSSPLCQCTAPSSPSPTNILPSFHHFVSPPVCTLSIPSCFRCFIPPASSSYLQYNAGRLRTRSAERLPCISLYLVDFIFIQGSNINSSSSFRILGYFALRSDRTHSRSGILSPDDPHASGGLIIFVSQGLSFYELSTSSPLFLCLNPSLIM